MCEQLKEVDEDCPLNGNKVIRKEVDIPKEVPPVSPPSDVLSPDLSRANGFVKGTYHVLADVFTKDNEKITCLEATVTFTLG